MQIKLFLKDDTVSVFNDVEYYIVSKLTLEIHHYNKTFRTIVKSQIRFMECE